MYKLDFQWDGSTLFGRLSANLLKQKTSLKQNASYSENSFHSNDFENFDFE
jgi:hypothetical protein